MNQEITFGQFIKEHRKKLDLTQAELARRVGCATITLRKIESDTLRPSVQIAERLAMTLNIPLEERADFIRLARHQFLKKLTPPKMPTPPPEPREIGGEDLTGRSVRGYQLGELIGSGGFGAVYRAVQPVVEREVAIKIILPEYADHPDFIRRFEAEAQLVARLEHPYIVPLYDYWREPSAAYLVLRLLRGGSLESVIKKGPVPLEFTMRIMGQIGRALQTAHRYGVIHRDIKPANIMLDEEENVYLTDFGIAKNLGNPNLENQTEIGAMVGTPSYMSPEQIRSESIMPQADIYSLGILLYELLTGKLPFEGITPIDMIMLHLSEPLPSVLSQNASLPSTLDPVIQKATAKDPAQRYPDVITMLAELHTATGYATDSMITSSKPIEKLLDSDPAEIENPYKGLRPFSEADADHFHGRGTLVQELLSKLSEENDLSRFLAVVGPSGSGKSSTVKAGLIPALRRGGLPGSDNWFIVDLIPGSHPFEELEAALLRVAVNPPESLLSQLKEDQSGLRRAVNRILPPDEDIELVLVIDQFEEVFTLMEDEEMRTLFLDSLISAVLDERSRVRIIVTIRADFTDRPLSYVDFGELMRSRSIFVLPLNADELEEAITRPASHVGLVIDPGLVAQIVREVGDQPGSLPLLQFALTEMFERREGRQLTSAVYQDSGGVFGALGRRAEELYQGLDDDKKQVVRQLFMRLVTLGEGVEDTRRRVQVTEFSGMGEQFQAIIDQFTKYRLLTSDRDPITRTPTIEVAHEALIREWESLRKWIADSREDIRNQRILLSASTAWNDANEDVSFLLRGARLAHYEDWLQNTTITLNEQEQAYLDVSLRQRELEEQQETERQERERALEKRSKNVLRWLVGVLLVAAVVSGIFAIQANSAEGEALRQAGLASTAAVDAQQQAELAAASAADAKAEAEARAIQQAIAVEQGNLASSRELSMSAVNLLGTDPELSILLSMQGLNTAYTKASESALHQSLQISRVRFALTDHSDEVANVVYSPDGTLLATVSYDRTIKIWDTNTWQVLLTIPYEGVILGEGLQGNDLKFDREGTRVYLVIPQEGSEGVILQVWAADSGELQSKTILPIKVDGGSEFQLSPDKTQLVVSFIEGGVELWDVARVERLLSLTDPGGEEINQSYFSSDGSRLVTLGYTFVTVWDVEASLEAGVGQVIATLKTEGDNTVVEFSQDNQRLAIGIEDVEIWDLSDTTSPVMILEGQDNVISKLVFNQDESVLFASSFNGTVMGWDTSSGDELFTLAGHKGLVTAMSLSADDNYMATASSDNTVRIWDVKPEASGEVRTMPISGSIFDMELSPDENWLARGSYFGPAEILDAETGELILSLSGDPDTGVYRVSFNPDGSRLATVGEDNIIRVWDTATGEALLSFNGHGEGNSGGFFIGTIDVDFSPDGSRFATAGTDGVAKIWDAETGELLITIDGHTAGLHSLTYSPDGSMLVTSADEPDSTVKVWNAETGELIYTLEGHYTRAWGLAFNPDSSILVSGGMGGVVKVWDMTTGKEMYTLPNQVRTVAQVAITADGKQLITVGEVVRIWDLETGAELLTLTPDRGTLALTADGNYLYIGVGNHFIGLYVLPLDEILSLAETRVTRWFTEDECQQYLHLDTCPPAP